jgi:hypothetical protein
VFYIPGYDPFPPRRYRELYRSEGAAQAAISGYSIALRAASADGVFGWHVNALIDGAEVEAEVEVLLWADLVRSSMERGIPATYLLLLRTAWAYIGTGTLFRLMRLRKGPVIAALYPIVMLTGQLALALGLAWAIAALLAPFVPGWAGWLAGLATLPFVLRWFRARDAQLFAYYLMHDYAYSAQSLGAHPPELTARMQHFADRIAAALASGADEVLVVGHSSGAHLAISVLADLLRAGRIPEGGPALSLLTLGQVVPMVSFLPGAKELRRDLQVMGGQDRIPWVDVTAPGDGCTFALCDPVAVSGVATEGKRWPLVVSAAFTRTLAPETWARLRWRFFRLHFQYLCAFDRPGDYDYFRITAGPLTLGARYAGRAASASRIERPASRYRDIAA